MGKKLIWVLFFSFGVAGCGNFTKGPDYAPPGMIQSSTVSNATDSLNDADPNYSCPLEPNVTPDYDWAMDGSGYYAVCSHRTQTSSILIHGTTLYSSIICVFPVEMTDTGQAFFKPNGATGGAIHECLQVSDEEGAKVQFDNIQFNAVFIVEKPFSQQMETCLVLGNYYQCPANADYSFSFGIVR